MKYQNLFFHSSNFSEFIYGECVAKSMEENYVRNDRETFIESDRRKHYYSG